eukprot:gene13697-19589_t
MSMTLEEICGLRLARDRKEVANNELAWVHAVPDQDDPTCWHGNVECPTGPLAGTSFHFELSIPADYPNKPPEIFLFTPIPHPNVIRTLDGNFRLALFDCVPSHSTWSPAFSIHSVLVQLQALLTDEDLIIEGFWSNRPTTQQVLTLANDFRCPACLHTGSEPFPKLAGLEGPDGDVHMCHRPPLGTPEGPAQAPPQDPAQAPPQDPAQAPPQDPIQAPPQDPAQTPPQEPIQPPTQDPAQTPPQEAQASNQTGATDPLGSTSLKTATVTVTAIPNALPTSAPPAGQENKQAPAGSWASVASKPPQPLGTGTPPKPATWAAVMGHGANSTPLQAATASTPPPAYTPLKPSSTPTQLAAAIIPSGPCPDLPSVSCPGPPSAINPSSGPSPGPPTASTITPPSSSTAPKPGTWAAVLGSEKPRPMVAHQPLGTSTPPPACTAPKAGTWAAILGSEKPKPMIAPQPKGTVPSGNSAKAALAQLSLAMTSGKAKSSKVPEANATAVKPKAKANGSGIKVLHTKKVITPSTASTAAATAPTPSAPASMCTTTTPAPSSITSFSEFTSHSSSLSSSSLSSSPAPSAPPSSTSTSNGVPTTSAPPSLTSLPQDILKNVLSILGPAQLSAVTSTSSEMRELGTSESMWHVFLKRDFPSSQLQPTPGGLPSWHAAYMLEAASCVDEFRCYYTREPACGLPAQLGEGEAVLGLPLRFTVNPKKRVVDYIEADPNLLSVDAFKAGVTHTPTNEDIQALLPLYLNPAHYAAAAMGREEALRKLTLTPAHRSPPPPACWLDVLPCLMNTCVVLLSDGVSEAGSQKALSVYIQVFRLLCALCEEHRLWPALESRLDRFLSSPKNRCKDVTPNLGHLIPLIALSHKHNWNTLRGVILKESLARSVLWVCKSWPPLVSRYKLRYNMIRGALPPVDHELLQGALEGSRVSHRLTMFHVAFLELIKPGTCRQADMSSGSTDKRPLQQHDRVGDRVADTVADRVADMSSGGTGKRPLQQHDRVELEVERQQKVLSCLDALYGRPGNGIMSKFHHRVRAIMCASTWPQIMALWGMDPLPGPACLSEFLRNSWDQSLRAGYHKKDMDFSKVQASGVSKILLKGESYSASPTLAVINLEERWRWAGGATLFLDASCLLYNNNGRMLDFVDYSSQNSSSEVNRRPRVSAVVHSGDCMDHQHSSGLHTIRIKLGWLSDEVHEMFITMSSWGSASLADIVQPFVKVVDPDQEMELCTYTLDEQPKHTRIAHTCVIMCRIYRNRVDRKRWEVQALGHLCQGRAGNYRPIQQGIKDVRKALLK